MFYIVFLMFYIVDISIYSTVWINFLLRKHRKLEELEFLNGRGFIVRRQRDLSWNEGVGMRKVFVSYGFPSRFVVHFYFPIPRKQ